MKDMKLWKVLRALSIVCGVITGVAAILGLLLALTNPTMSFLLLVIDVPGAFITWLLGYASKKLRQ